MNELQGFINSKRMSTDIIMRFIGQKAINGTEGSKEKG